MSNSDRNEPSLINQVSQATNTGSHRWLLCHQQPNLRVVIHKLCGRGQCWDQKAPGS